jgi:hypothetical protein
MFFTNVLFAKPCIAAYLFLLISGCGPKEPEFVPGSLGGVNHTSEAVNWYSVNGWGGRNVPPHSMYGGGTCCIPMPVEWEPGIMFTVKWETDPNPYAHLPKIGGEKFRVAYEEHKKGYRLHKKVIELPKYSEDGLCSLEVHFMPCNEIKFSTSCWGYPSVDGPIQEPLEMPEPAVCPK